MADIPLQIGGFGNALATGIQLRNAGIHAEREQEELNVLRRRKTMGGDVQAAIGGDSGALGRIAAVDPDYALKIGPIMTAMDEKARAKAKAGAEYTYNAANAILQANPADRPAIYRQMVEQGKAMGHDLSKLPPEYTPQMEGQLRTWRQMAIPVLEQWKADQDRPQPIGTAGATAPAAPASVPGSGGGALGAAIAGIESAGTPNGGYGAVGPAANAQGSRAYGRYQVMDFNIGPWTQEVLGKPMTPQEFLANPQAQDAVFNAKFGQYVQKYGSPQAASRAWFAGEGGMNNPAAADVNGMTVANYEKRFSAGLPTGAAPGVPGPVASPPAQGSEGDGSGTPVPPMDPRAATRGIQLPPGARLMGHKGVPIVKDGTVMVMMQDGSIDFVPLPQRKDAVPFGWTQGPNGVVPTPGGPFDPATIRQQAQARTIDKPPVGFQANPGGGLAPIPGGPADVETIRREAEARAKPQLGNQPPPGPFGGTAMDAQAMNIVLRGDPATPEYAAAFAHLAQPKVQLDPNSGQMIQIKPDMSWARQPGGAAATLPSAPPQAGDKGVSVERVPGLDPRMTEDQGKAAGFADRMAESESAIEKFGSAALSPSGKLLERVPIAGNYLQTPEYRQYEQARRDFINAVLRRESGAVISAEEFSNAEKQYFPQPGDDPDTLAQKQRNRQIAIDSMKRAAGPAYKAPQPRAATTPGAPAVGTVEQGYRFKGGDPSKPESWEKVQ